MVLLVLLGITVALAPFWVALYVPFEMNEMGLAGDRRSGASGPGADGDAPARRDAPPIREARPTRKRAVEYVPETPRGRVQGRLRTGRDGDDLSGARIAVLHATGEAVAVVNASSDGAYLIRELPARVPLVLRITAPGFLTGYCCDLVLADDVPAVRDVDLLAAPPFALRVVVLPGRKPLPGVRVDLLQGESAAATGSTGQDGLCTIRPPIVGQFGVRLSHPDYVMPKGFDLDLWLGDRPPEKVIEIDAAGTIEVAAFDDAGRPVADVDVRLGLAGTPDWPSQRTDKEGVARFRGLAVGTAAQIVARGPGGTAGRSAAVASASGSRTSILLAEPGRVTGWVVHEFSAVEGATVEGTVAPFGDSFRLRTDDGGGFASPPLAPGTVSLVIRKRGFDDWRPSAKEPPLVVNPNAETRVKAQLVRRPFGSILVTVVDEARQPIESAGVRLLPSQLTGRTDEDGTYRFDGVPAPDEMSLLVTSRGRRMKDDLPVALGVRPNLVVPVLVVMQPASVQDGATPAAQGVAAAAGRTSIASSWVAGLLLDPAFVPVGGATVAAGGQSIQSDGEGRFRLDEVKRSDDGGDVKVVVLPGRPGLLEPFSFWFAPQFGPMDVGTVRFRKRPYVRIVVPDPPAGSRPGARTKSAVFWFTANHGDTFLGRNAAAFQPFSCVTYDGTWMHIPPAEDWRRDGRGEVYLAFATPHGLAAATSSWTLRPDDDAVTKPAPVGNPGVVYLEVPQRLKTKANATFVQADCGVLFDPKCNDSLGYPLPTVDPFASLRSQRTFEVEVASYDNRVDAVAPGKWRVSVPEKAGSGEVNVPSERTVRFGR